MGFSAGRFFCSSLFCCLSPPLWFPFVHFLCTPWNLGSFFLNTLLFIDKKKEKKRVFRLTHAAKSASIAFVAQTGNASTYLAHSLGPWILNSSAFDHLFGNKNLFYSLTITSPLPMITLANGTQTMAKGIGSACPLPSLPHFSFLYVPNSPFNLISISKLIHDLNCSITFSHSFVTLQDQRTGRMIGIGHESQGFYHLSSAPSSIVYTSTDESLLVHRRLGHSNISKL